MRFEKKIAVVTGAAGGIGKAIALSLAKEGADLVLNDIAADSLTVAADQITAMGRTVLAIRASVTNSKEIKQMVKSALDAFGAIDILVNVAGGSKASPFHKTPDRYWNRVIDLNLKGTLICCHEVIGPMIERGGGNVVNIASTAGMIGSATGLSAYSAAKAGVIGFTKSLAKELAPHGIRVNCVSPGPIETPLMQLLSPEIQRKVVADTYLKRLGKPEEIANMALFLASDEANFITGQNCAVCGGRSLGW